MSVPGYSSYRDSGVQWLGAAPSHWDIVRLRRLVEIKKRIVGEEGPDVLSITQRGIKVRDTTSNDGQLASSYAHYQLVQPGDFAMNHMDLLTGWVDISARHGVTSPDYRVFGIRHDAKVDPRYLLRVLQLGYTGRTFFALGQGSSHLGRWRLPADAFNDFEVAFPPLAEQTAIAAFLDRETGKIDTLVETQRRLIELLKEKRQAVISHAVTKGLDPFAPMQASEIDWVDEVPSGWSCVPIMSVAEVVDPNPSHRNPEYVDDGYPFISTQEFLPNGDIEMNTPRRVSEITVLEQEKRCRFIAGSIAFSRKGTIGEARVLPHGMRIGLLDSLCVINPKDGIDPQFLLLALKASYVVAQYSLLTRGAALPQLSVGSVRSLKIVRPPLSEQTEIVSVVDQHVAANIALTQEAEAAIALLQERRNVLIYSAVTGKIDVRGLVPQCAEAA